MAYVIKGGEHASLVSSIHSVQHLAVNKYSRRWWFNNSSWSTVLLQNKSSIESIT